MDRAVSRRLGHTDIVLTLSIYTHLMEKNADELNSELERISKDIHKDDESNDK